MEQALGRPLRDGENVHHLNGQRADNRLENLELWYDKQPKGQRVHDKREWAQWFLLEYEADFPSEFSPTFLALAQQYVAEHEGERNDTSLCVGAKQEVPVSR